MGVQAIGWGQWPITTAAALLSPSAIGSSSTRIIDNGLTVELVTKIVVVRANEPFLSMARRVDVGPIDDP